MQELESRNKMLINTYAEIKSMSNEIEKKISLRLEDRNVISSKSLFGYNNSNGISKNTQKNFNNSYLSKTLNTSKEDFYNSTFNSTSNSSTHKLLYNLKNVFLFYFIFII